MLWSDKGMFVSVLKEADLPLTINTFGNIPEG